MVDRPVDGAVAPLATFRIYPDDKCSFMDYCRLLRSAYPRAADMSANPTAFAKEIAYSPYISEVNGDNREAYRKLIVQLCRKISSQLSIVNQKGGQMPSLSSTVN